MTTASFNHWGIVEIMGHQKAIGRLTEEQLAGGTLLRVDIPTGDGPEDFRTAYYGAGSIFSIQITGEAEARALLKRGVASPAPFAWILERPALEHGSGSGDGDFE